MINPSPLATSAKPTPANPSAGEPVNGSVPPLALVASTATWPGVPSAPTADVDEVSPPSALAGTVGVSAVDDVVAPGATVVDVATVVGDAPVVVVVAPVVVVDVGGVVVVDVAASVVVVSAVVLVVVAAAVVVVTSVVVVVEVEGAQQPAAVATSA